MITVTLAEFPGRGWLNEKSYAEGISLQDFRNANRDVLPNEVRLVVNGRELATSDWETHTLSGGDEVVAIEAVKGA